MYEMTENDRKRAEKCIIDIYPNANIVRSLYAHEVFRVTMAGCSFILYQHKTNALNYHLRLRLMQVFDARTAISEIEALGYPVKNHAIGFPGHAERYVTNWVKKHETAHGGKEEAAQNEM